jgi:hypothetical protein
LSFVAGLVIIFGPVKHHRVPENTVCRRILSCWGKTFTLW